MEFSSLIRESSVEIDLCFLSKLTTLLLLLVSLRRRKLQALYSRVVYCTNYEFLGQRKFSGSKLEGRLTKVADKLIDDVNSYIVNFTRKRVI